MRPILWALALIGAAPLSQAQEQSGSRVDAAIERRRESIQSRLDREGVTGDWFGYGETLAGHGIRFEAAMTLFGQAAASRQDSAAFFGGKLDGLLRADLAELGLWGGLSLTVHPEYNFGEAANGFGGAILPLNSALQLPGTTPGKRYDTSSLFFRQRFNDTFSLIAGKTNLSDISAFHPYAGGAGVRGFMNGGIAAAPSGTLPAYVWGGMLAAKLPRAVLSLGVYGGTSARDSLDFTQAFDDGYILSAGVAIPVRPGGLPGNQSLTVVWGERDPGLEGLDYFVLPGGAAAPSVPDNERYSVKYSFHQQLGRWGSSDRAWGVWGRAGVGDNELSAVAWSAAGGVGGDSPLPGRERDRWGLGGFYFEFADFLAEPANSPMRLGAERGVELFYNAELKPWLHVSGDVQFVNPAVAGLDNFFVFGLRASVRF